MIDLGAILQWWNFMFLLPLVSGLVLALGAALVGAGLDGGAEDGVGDGVGEGFEGKGEGGLLQLLGFFGFGRGLPLSVLLPILLVAWGAAGLLFNGVLSPFSPLLFAPLSAIAGFGLAALAGRSLAVGFVRLFLGGGTVTRAGGLLDSCAAGRTARRMSRASAPPVVPAAPGPKR